MLIHTCKFPVLHVLGPLIPKNMTVNPDPRADKIGFIIEWHSPSFDDYDTRIKRYSIAWKAWHTEVIKHAELEETESGTGYEVSTSSEAQLTKGETYEITVVSVSYNTFSVINGSNQINDTIGKLLLFCDLK